MNAWGSIYQIRCGRSTLNACVIYRVPTIRRLPGKPRGVRDHMQIHNVWNELAGLKEKPHVCCRCIRWVNKTVARCSMRPNDKRLFLFWREARWSFEKARREATNALLSLTVWCLLVSIFSFIQPATTHILSCLTRSKQSFQYYLVIFESSAIFFSIEKLMSNQQYSQLENIHFEIYSVLNNVSWEALSMMFNCCEKRM